MSRPDTSYRAGRPAAVTRTAAALGTAAALALCGLAACSRQDPAPPAATTAPEVGEGSAAAGLPAVVFLGDSLTAGYGLAEEQAYPALIEQRMRAGGLDLPVVNAGVSGDTTAGGLARLDWLLQEPIAVLFVALGANDGLRGAALPEIERNLSTIVARGREAGARVILAGMRLPINYGPVYRSGFEQLFREVARRHAVPLVPFLLEGVGGVERLNQADGLHPTAEGQRAIADAVWPVLEPVMRAAHRELSARNSRPPTAVR